MDNAKLVRNESVYESDTLSGWLSISKPLMTAEEFIFLLPHHISINAIEETENFLRQAGAQDCEGAVLWIAEREVDSFRVQRVIAPRQSASRWHFDVPLEERMRIAMTLREKQVVLLQVHSHPEEAFHSPRDDRKAMVDRQWALSIVVPNFCRDGMRDLNKLSAYSLRGPLDWVQLSFAQLQRLLVIQ
jgi:hypothetical protein